MRMKLATALIIVTMAASTAYAVPILQTYIPGATYNDQTESWLSLDIPFTLQVLGSSKNGSVTFIDDPMLHIAVPNDWWEPGTTVTLTGPGYEGGLTISDWVFGTPDGLSSHGIYPARYASLTLPDMDVANGTDIIPDYNPGGDGQDTGVIWEYEMSYSEAFGIHMDATGTALKSNGKWADVFAPYSHDADADRPPPPLIPEPGTLLLLGAALAAKARGRRRR